MARFYGVDAHPGQQLFPNDSSDRNRAEGHSEIEGPHFDFSNSAVVAAAQSLTEKARELREILCIPGSKWAEIPTRHDYEELIRCLTGRMPALYAAYDAYLSAVLATGQRPIHCAPACPSCCSHYVTSVEPVELIYIDHQLKRRAEYSDRLVAMHEKTQIFRGGYRTREGDEAEDKALYRYFLKDQRCVFLTKSGDCGIREIRPMSCRMFFSYSDPKWCRGRKVATPANKNFHIGLPDEAETLLAEASHRIGELRLSEHFFDGLLQVNEILGRF